LPVSLTFSLWVAVRVVGLCVVAAAGLVVIFMQQVCICQAGRQLELLVLAVLVELMRQMKDNPAITA
jgi:hypothetical protein